MAQLGQKEKFTLHYFGVKGAAGAATICLEQGGIDYTAKSYMMDTWPDFKPKTPTGMLPVLEYEDGTMIPESGSIERVAAAMAGLLGEGRDYARSEALIGMCGDLWKQVGGNVPTLMTVKDFPAEKTAKWNEEYKGKVKTMLETSFVKMLIESDKYTTRGDTLGEMVFWFRLYQLIQGPYADVLTDVPALKPFYDRVGALQGPSKMASDTTKFGPLIHYFVPWP